MSSKGAWRCPLLSSEGKKKKKNMSKWEMKHGKLKQEIRIWTAAGVIICSEGSREKRTPCSPCTAAGTDTNQLSAQNAFLQRQPGSRRPCRLIAHAQISTCGDLFVKETLGFLSLFTFGFSWSFPEKSIVELPRSNGYLPKKWNTRLYLKDIE